MGLRLFRDERSSVRVGAILSPRRRVRLRSVHPRRTCRRNGQRAYPTRASTGRRPWRGTTQGPSESYVAKLREIEERVSSLKEKIFRSKARLIQLQEVVLHGSSKAARLRVVHRNDMGDSFRLWRVQYFLDGTPIFDRSDQDTGSLYDLAEFDVFHGNVAPGVHLVDVALEYRGNGFGFFTYMDGYTFNVRGDYTFNVPEGTVTTVTVGGYEKDGFMTQLQDRPALRYDTVVQPVAAGRP